MKANIKWSGEMKFTANNNGHEVQMDSPSSNTAPSPKDLLLDAMLGCTAMDTISLMTKMRQDIDKFSIDVDAVKNKEHPIHFISNNFNFHIEGSGDKMKIIKAVDKSLNKYCGVNYMIGKTSKITYNVYFNKELIHSAKSKFEEPGS